MLTEGQLQIRDVARQFAQRELAPTAADGATSTAFQVHNRLVCLPILRHGTPEQKERFLKPLARGEKLGASCLTEPGAGSDAAAIVTRARQRRSAPAPS